MRYFPVFMDIENQPVLVVGAGSVAERKVRALLRAGGRVRVVANTLNDALEQLHAAGSLEWTARAYAESQLDGARLVFAATDDVRLNRRVYADAEARGIPVNVVDDRRHCRFISPALVDRSPLQIAISSGGASPVLARRVRAWIERLLPPGIGKVAEAAGRVRAAAARIPLEARRRFWDRHLDQPSVMAWSLRDTDAIEADLRRSLATRGGSNPVGRVILVGAGPGRADLLTIRAHRALGQADVILHDKLVPREILDVARRDAEFIDVGKRSGDHQETQENIHRLLVAHARRGRVVVRLKGGDPFIFGRGGEELEHLRAHGIHYEVIPGVTAASACAAYAGIPLTHRDHAHALTLITGHTPPGGEEPAWAELAGEGRTLAVYMGLKQAAALRRKLLDAGLGGSLPVALVADGTRDTQQVVHGTLDSLPAMAARITDGAPALFIIGRVAAIGERLAWFRAPAAERAAA